MRRFFVPAAFVLGFLVLGSSLGCVVLAIGAAGTGGYYVGSDSRSVGTIMNDAAITASVKSKLLGDSDIKGLQINVDTHDGVVTLHGKIRSRSARRKATSLARGVEGVTRVKNQLEIE